MTLNVSGERAANSSGCGHNMTSWDRSMDAMYTYIYLLIFIPGLLLNTTALWVLCRHISKKSKAVIFMMNLALADLAHVLSLPLRIYYYFTLWWPFGHHACLFCFYLKYLNMYAAIVFLVCISVQRCVFLLHPFSARGWRRRYDLVISAVVWVVVGLACSPFILMRSSSSSKEDASLRVNLSRPLGATPTQQAFSELLTNASVGATLTSGSAHVECFKDLPMRHLALPPLVTLIVFALLFGFVIPLACIGYSTVRIVQSLNQQCDKQSSAPLDPSGRGRHQSASSACQAGGAQTNGEKRRALRMVLACSALFLLCYAPYHLNFPLYLLVSHGALTHCGTVLAVRQFHPVSLCLASLSCCLNPLLYYFLTAEFRMLTRRTFSFSSSLVSSPVTSPTHSHLQPRFTRVESTCSDTKDKGS